MAELFGRPFENQPSVSVVLPVVDPNLSETEQQQVRDIRKLFEEHRGPLERELGAPFRFSSDPSVNGPKWLVGPFKCNPEIAKLGLVAPDQPQIFLDRKNKILVTHGRTPGETEETYSYIRSLGNFRGGVWDIKECCSIDEAIQRIVTEVKTSYPSFVIRGLNWDQVCEQHIPKVKSADDPIPAMQRWLAELQDAHTWVRPFPPLAELPHDLKVNGNSGVFYNVSNTSAAWKAGVRPGYYLLDQNYLDWWERTSASSHSKPWIVGKRVLTSVAGKKRVLRAKAPDGKIVEWEEEPLSDRWNPAVCWRKLESGSGYLRIQAWMTGKKIEEDIDEAFAVLKGCSKLIVDLRASPGGNLLMAQKFRNRFLRKDGTLGWIQSTLPDGQLSEKEPILGEVSSAEKRWNKPVVFLTDALTYSASEDVMLGLQGLDHVQVVGQRSGGGSGRMRLIRLLPGYRLTISTALTFDVQGHCVEGNGIPVDVSVAEQGDFLRDAALELADSATKKVF